MVCVAIIGILAVIALPRFAMAKNEVNDKRIANDLRMIDAGKEQWALMYGMGDGDEPDESDVAMFLRGDFPEPPDFDQGGFYTINPVGTYPTHTPA